MFSLHLKQDLTFGVLLVMYIHFWHVWFAHIVCMLEVTEKPQENAKIMRRHEAHGRVWLLRNDNTDETHTPKQLTQQ